VGTSLATAAADEGIGRILAATPAADGGTRSASASAEWWVELRNNSDSVVSFAPGAFQAEWSFELSKTESTVGSARFSAIANGSLSTIDAGTSVGYRHFDETGAPAAFVVGAGVRSGGGTFSILSATETSFLARIASGAVDLQPGAGGRVTVTFQVALVAGAGWAGTLDATRSVHLSLALPQGVSIESPRPLGFVTAVPEPSSAVLALLGLALLAAGRRLQRDA
jgi:MYXO-CTERM domain-containing protein